MCLSHLAQKLPHRHKERKRKRNATQNFGKLLSKKRKLNSGKGYEFKDKKGQVTSTKVKKTMKPPCPETCRKKCSDAFSEEERQLIFDDFWKLGDVNMQRAFLNSNVIVSDKERTRVRTTCKTTRRKKEHSRNYFLDHPTVKSAIPVCQKFFLNTLSIDEKRVRTALAKKSDTGT